MVTPEINLALLQGIGKAKYQDFTYIARLNIDPIVLIVPTDSPFKTLEDVIAKAKAKPGEVALANSGKGATYHLAAIALENKRSEEHTSELQSLMRISYAVFCLKKKKRTS